MSRSSLRRLGVAVCTVAMAALAFSPVASQSASVDDGYGELVFVPAGPFLMGDDAGVGEPRERPAHTVELDAFYIAKYETTNAQWKRFLEDPGYQDTRFWPDGRVVPIEQIPYWTQPTNHGGATPDSANYPVIGVNWDAAVAYCRWLSAKTGKTYRLPTEAEWEKAARGADGRRYPWGDTIDHDVANFVGSQSYDTVMPVGYFDGSRRGDHQTRSNASPYGAFDMAGNVMEWTADWYSRDYYASSPSRNPTGPETGAYRVIRGGAFNLDPSELRTSGRTAAWPSFKAHRMVGFRVAREP